MANASVDIKVYHGKTMTAQDFALTLEHLSPVPKGIITGCSVTMINGSTLNITAGWCLLRGRIIAITTGDIGVRLLSEGSPKTQYLVIRVNLANATGTYGPIELQVLDSIPADDANFNENTGIAYLKLAQFTVSTTTISDLVSETPMTPTRAIRIGTADPLPSLGEDGDIYIKITN